MYIKTAGISDVSFEIYKDGELYDTVNIEKNCKNEKFACNIDSAGTYYFKQIISGSEYKE